MLSFAAAFHGLLTVALLTYHGEASPDGRVIQVLEDKVGADNFTYYRLQRSGVLRLELVSIKGDVDIYVSTEVQHPDYNLYDLKSDTCGKDIINIPSKMQRPVFISVFGHPNHIESKYRFTIFELQEQFVEDYEYLVNKYERYYFEEMEQELSGRPKSYKSKEESPKEHSSIPEEEEDEAPLWWEILVGILKICIDVSIYKLVSQV
ncbi:UPF0669 protein C6orf120 homolog [Elysia marginata]|uniref:UPF0669 protein C6orf120 homolog n=1 Tax=Elysia marginata TaxID=1093978 RepID=A0AAV4HD14_9GAST|nr:UPF0669 protein C6orf120 homolog [Elysia marginata]